MNSRTNLQVTTALLLTKMEVKEESQMKGGCRRPGYYRLNSLRPVSYPVILL